MGKAIAAFSITAMLNIWRLILDRRTTKCIVTMQKLMKSEGYLNLWFLLYRRRLGNKKLCNNCGLTRHPA